MTSLPGHALHSSCRRQTITWLSTWMDFGLMPTCRRKRGIFHQTQNKRAPQFTAPPLARLLSLAAPIANFVTLCQSSLLTTFKDWNLAFILSNVKTTHGISLFLGGCDPRDSDGSVPGPHCSSHDGDYNLCPLCPLMCVDCNAFLFGGHGAFGPFERNEDPVYLCGSCAKEAKVDMDSNVAHHQCDNNQQQLVNLHCMRGAHAGSQNYGIFHQN
jgi:hypothetical protein